MEAASHWEIFHIQLTAPKWCSFTINNNSLQRLILAFFSLEVRSPFWTEFSNAKWNKFIETGAAIFAKLLARIIFIFTRVSRECQMRAGSGDEIALEQEHATSAHAQEAYLLTRTSQIALQVVRTSFGFHLRECMGSCFPPWISANACLLLFFSWILIFWR